MDGKHYDVDLELRPLQGKVIVDGKDLSNKVYKVELQSTAGEIPHVVLYMRVATVRVFASGSLGFQTLTLDGEGTPD